MSTKKSASPVRFISETAAAAGKAKVPSKGFGSSGKAVEAGKKGSRQRKREAGAKIALKRWNYIGEVGARDTVLGAYVSEIEMETLNAKARACGLSRLELIVRAVREFEPPAPGKV